MIDSTLALGWILLFILFIITEAVTMQLTTIWFAGGSLVAFLSVLLGAPIGVQIAIFLVVSFVLLIATRPLAKKLITVNKTNIDSLIGQNVIVTQTIDNKHNTGKVKIKDLDWTARNQDDTVIPEGETVKILKIQGVKLIVTQEGEKS